MYILPLVQIFNIPTSYVSSVFPPKNFARTKLLHIANNNNKGPFHFLSVWLRIDFYVMVWAGSNLRNITPIYQLINQSGLCALSILVNVCLCVNK